MKSNEWNKLAAAGLFALVVVVATGVLSKEVFHNLKGKSAHHEEDGDHPKRAYAIADPSVLAASSTGKKPAKPAGPESIIPLLAGADIEAGMKVAKKCTSCHSFEKGGPNKVGPALWNIVDVKQCNSSDYPYSKALLAKDGKWTYQDLNEFLYKPAHYAKGTKMSFAGLKKTQDRANIIAYLRSLSDAPAPLPDVEAAPTDTADEAPAAE